MIKVLRVWRMWKFQTNFFAYSIIFVCFISVINCKNREKNKIFGKSTKSFDDHRRRIPRNSENVPVYSSTRTIENVTGRDGWCLNEVELANMTVKGKFQCPEAGQNANWNHCCGRLGEQFCCDPLDTPGVKWGIAVAVTVGILVFIAVGYTIQVFRACDRCYHECPICSSTTDEPEFLWNTRWYTVCHEGNRYGVTFHSRRFAKHFMAALETRYGPWNTANILKIKRHEHDFVVLNIYFHDLFTPWFYTQGPIKNDEEWIKSDFKEMCYQVREDLAMRPCLCCGATVKDESYEQISIDPNCSSANPQSTVTKAGRPINGNVSTSPPPRQFKPWTKTTFRLTSPSQRPVVVDTRTTVIIEDIIEEFGNDKAIQTRREVRI